VTGQKSACQNEAGDWAKVEEDGFTDVFASTNVGYLFEYMMFRLSNVFWAITAYMLASLEELLGLFSKAHGWDWYPLIRSLQM
jgi:hypothetical protein